MGSFGGKGNKNKSFKANKGGGGQSYTTSTPAQIIECGTVLHACEDELVVRSTLENQVPYFNGRIFLSNKQEIGKIDEILGPLNEYYFSIKLFEGIKARSFESNSKLYIDPQQTLPMARFLVNPSASMAAAAVKKKKVKKDKAFNKVPSRGTIRLNRGNSKMFRGTVMRGRGK